MAAALILATNTTGADSSDLVVASGTPVTVALKGVIGSPLVLIKLKDDAGAYQQVGELTGDNRVRVITGPGTYLFTRVANGATCGVFSA